MKFHIRTIQLFLVAVTGPMWALSVGAKAGCMLPIVILWSVLVFIPLGLMGAAWQLAESESLGEKLGALLAAIAIIGYLFASFLTLLITVIPRPTGL
jgi:hypothetical protein